MLGFCLTLGLALVSMTLIIVKLWQAQQMAMVLAAEGQQITYYLGDTGEELARLRAHVALGLEEAPQKFSERSERISQIDSALQNDINEIDAKLNYLDSPERRRWETLKFDILQLRRSYMAGAFYVQKGQTSRAQDVLTQKAVLTVKVHDALDDMAQMHRQKMLETLKAARQAASVARMLALLVGAVFVTAMLVIWTVVFKKLDRQALRLVETNARLEAANSDLDAFAGRAAHDLRNAIGPILMAPSLLRRTATDSARVLEVADRTESYSTRAIAVIDALLAFSRASKQVEASESGMLRLAVKNVVEESAPMAARIGVTVEVGELPEVVVHCNPGLLHVVLANIYGNSVKYLEGQSEKRVCISAHIEDASCRIEVADTGPGIPKDALQKIFEPFFRIEGVRVAGTGIGLATVRRIVDARGGHIAVKSVEGKGSCFTVWLPIVPPPKDRSPTS